MTPANTPNLGGQESEAPELHMENREDFPRTSPERHTLTYLLLSVLLFLRVSEAVVDFTGTLIMHDSGATHLFRILSATLPMIYFLYEAGGIILIVIMIASNRRDLARVHVDSLFIVLLLFSGLMVFLREWASPSLRWLTGAAMIFLLILFWRKSLTFGPINPLVVRISAGVIGLFLLCVLILGSRLNMTAIIQTMHFFWLDTIPDATYEEIIYRGALWMLLADLGLSDGKIIWTQALLFWASHIDRSLLDPADFWLTAPITGVVFGLMTLRSKSITPSTIAHILINLLLGWIALIK